MFPTRRRPVGPVTSLPCSDSSKVVRELGWRAELALDDVCLRLAVAEPKQVRLFLTCGRGQWWRSRGRSADRIVTTKS